VFTLAEVVPWGRSFDEYRQMFALTDADANLAIIGCADGPASFNAHATRRGMRVTSCDPLYRWSEPEIRQRIAATYDTMLQQTGQNAGEFIWNAIGSVAHLGRIRMEAMAEFLGDYEAGKAQGRYVDAALPQLPYADASFDLALCSHFLFLYTTQLGARFHRAAITELCRVAAEVRIFPLLALDGRGSPYVDQNLDALSESGFVVSLERVPYEFQRGGNEMMRIRDRR
jgi:hypothetical protein